MVCHNKFSYHYLVRNIREYVLTLTYECGIAVRLYSVIANPKSLGIEEITLKLRLAIKCLPNRRIKTLVA